MTIKGLLYLDLDERQPRGFSTSKPKLWWPRGFSTLMLKKGNQGLLPWNWSCDDQRASLPWSWRKVAKGLLYLKTKAVRTKGLLYLGTEAMKMSIKGFSTLILIEGNQGASLPRNQSYDDQRASLPQSWWKVTKGILYLRIEAVEMSIKGLLYFDLNCWNVDQRASLHWSEFFECRSKGFSTLIWIVEMLIKGLLYFDLNCWNVYQMASLLWSCYGNVDQRASLIWSRCWNVD